jgi:hypothetical protein
LTKNCEVALLMSLVRAIDSVPRSFLRPLSASFLIGGWVFFWVMSSVKPPPWITNPATMR